MFFQRVLLELLSPTTWTTSQVANIISAVGAAGTVWALWYAYYLERKNSKRIDNLATMAEELKQQNKLLMEQNVMQKQKMLHQVKPDFITGGVAVNGSHGTLGFIVQNVGQEATLTDISYKEEDVIFMNKGNMFPIRIKKGTELRFEAKTKTKLINECAYEVQLQYKDSLGNEYSTVITGIGDIRPEVKTHLK